MAYLEVILLILVLACSCHSLSYKKAAQRTNVAIVVNIQERSPYFFTLLEEIVNGIPLSKYRLSLYATDGTVIRLSQFQNRKCMLKKLKRDKGIGMGLELAPLLKRAEDDVLYEFSGDRFYILLFTDERFDDVELGILDSLRNHRKCDKLYILNVNPYISDIAATLNSNIYLVSNTRNNEEYYLQKVKKHLTFVNENVNRCSGGDSQREVLDECYRSCKCIDGRLQGCTRLRKEFSSMTETERKRYIRAYKELSTSKKYKALYNQYCSIHKKRFYSGIHNQSQFFPWHRRYILGFENLLRLVDCRVTVPVWNWALFSDIAWKVTPFYHMWRRESGFGGNGSYANGYCVLDGEFRYNSWKPARYEMSYKVLNEICRTKTCVSHCMTYKSCLRRRFNKKPPSYRKVLKLLSNDSLEYYGTFELVVRGVWHNLVHNLVGGHMETDYASDAPEFWSHHGMLDSLWDEWQKKSDQHLRIGYEDDDVMLKAFRPEQYRTDFVDNRNLDWCVRVRYDVFDWDRVRDQESEDEENGNSRTTDEIEDVELMKGNVFKVNEDEEEELKKILSDLYQ